MYTFLRENWFEALSAIAGLISMILAVTGYFSTRKSETVAFNFSVNESHERVWNKFFENPGLKRVTEDSVDLGNQPISQEEELFVLSVIKHLTSTLKAIELGQYKKPAGMELDVTNFFRKPVPQAVARKYLDMQSSEVRELLQDALKPIPR